MRNVVALLFILVLAVGASPACAQKKEAAPDVTAAASVLQATFPTIQYESIHPTPVEGLFEVVTPDRVVYFAPEPRLLFLGEIFDPKGRSLTRERQASVMEGRVDKLPLDKALKIGDGENVVIEITDPDCPFCRKGSNFLSERNDITRYIFLYPLKMHPEAEEKSRYILSSEHPEEAYEDVMAGRYDGQPVPEFTDNGLLDAHMTAVRSLGVRGTPKYWVNGHYLSGADIDRMKELLGDEPKTGTAD